MAILGLPDRFHNAGRGCYTVEYDEGGKWINAYGRPCHLAVVALSGTVQRVVEPDALAPGDAEAIEHFDLAPWRLAGCRDRRRRNEARPFDRRGEEALPILGWPVGAGFARVQSEKAAA